jgi:hypothetical protein
LLLPFRRQLLLAVVGDVEKRLYQGIRVVDDSDVVIVTEVAVEDAVTDATEATTCFSRTAPASLESRWQQA